MPYVVEILISNGDLADQMAQMRTWLDHKDHMPLAFRSSADSLDRSALRIEFAFAAEADAFAQAFGGQLVRPQTAQDG